MSPTLYSLLSSYDSILFQTSLNEVCNNGSDSMAEEQDGFDGFNGFDEEV